MPTTQLRLETVTPMFLHGHDSQTLELRPPPFKALFRYWWRATVGETNEDRLREREGDLFGNTKKRSPILVRIPGPVPSPNNGRFNIRLTAPRLNQYEEIAEISFLLGGVGNRSRLGFGSIRYQPGWNFQTVLDLQDKVYQTLNGIVAGRFHRGTNIIQVSPELLFRLIQS